MVLSRSPDTILSSSYWRQYTPLLLSLRQAIRFKSCRPQRQFDSIFWNNNEIITEISIMHQLEHFAEQWETITVCFLPGPADIMSTEIYITGTNRSSPTKPEFPEIYFWAPSTLLGWPRSCITPQGLLLYCAEGAEFFKNIVDRQTDLRIFHDFSRCSVI